MKKLRHFEQVDQAKQRFIQLANMFKDYEKKLFDDWLKSFTIGLKETLLIDLVQSDDDLLVEKKMARVARCRLPLFIDDSSMKNLTRQSNERCRLSQVVLHPFDPKKNVEIRFLIRSNRSFSQMCLESFYLQRLNFNLPQSIIEFTFQSKKIDDISRDLRSMIENYHLLLSSLDAIEVSLLKTHLDQLNQTIRTGATTITWADLGLEDYVRHCEKKIEQFQSILNEIRHIFHEIHEHREAIRLCQLDSTIPCRADGLN